MTQPHTYSILNRATPDGNFRDVTHKNTFLRRRNEEVDYWKKRAGWFDDDVSMQEFNAGVYDTYYSGDDIPGSSGAGSSSTHKGVGGDSLSLGLKIGAAVVAIIIAIVVFRILSRRSSKKKKVGSSSKSKSGRSTSGDSKSRSRSRSRARSRSRSRRAGTSGSVATSNYELMDDNKSEARSKSSRRSRSRSRRRSKSSSRRSKSSSRKSSSSVKMPAEKDSREVLVWWMTTTIEPKLWIFSVFSVPVSTIMLGQALAPSTAWRARRAQHFCVFLQRATVDTASSFYLSKTIHHLLYLYLLTLWHLPLEIQLWWLSNLQATSLM